MEKKPQPVFTIKPEQEGFTVYRDAEPLKTPRSLPVNVPTQGLAEAIRQECIGQGEKLDLRQMPLTQMALTAIDISTQHRAEVIDGILRYGESELICQRADEPADLVSEQTRVWQPYLAWCQKEFGVELRTGSGIIPFLQKPESLSVLRSYVETYDAFRLTGMSEAVGVMGSLILGMALIKGHASVDAVFEAAELDQLWQGKKWGNDPAVENRQIAIKRDLALCAQWIELLA